MVDVNGSQVAYYIHIQLQEEATERVFGPFYNFDIAYDALAEMPPAETCKHKFIETRKA